MDIKVAREILSVIKSERRRRRVLLSGENDDYAYDQWRFDDLPFINELCLTLLVAVLHQVERELVLRAARVSADGAPIDKDVYQERVRQRRKDFRERRMSNVAAELGLTIPDWLEALRLVANCYKHDPSARPDEKLLNHLRLPLKPNEPLVEWYASLSESQLFLDGLAAFLDVREDADYCAVTEDLLSRTEEFMADIERSGRLSPVDWGPISLAKFEG
jgi:hypothetical protein